MSDETILREVPLLEESDKDEHLVTIGTSVHDLRNAVYVVTASLEQMRRTPERTPTLIDRALRGANRIEELVEELAKAIRQSK